MWRTMLTGIAMLGAGLAIGMIAPEQEVRAADGRAPLPSAAEGEHGSPSMVDLVALNEFLADPPPDLAGDANGDGTRDSAEDEFVEILNYGATPVDISGWTIQDATGVRHEFAKGVTLEAGEIYVVFGGGTPTGIPSRSDVASSGGLSLNNTADEVKLVGADAVNRDAHAFGAEGNEDQSVARIPDATGAWSLPHDAGYTWSFSPGVLNESPSPVESESWGRVKSLYRE
jgi:hypothetical protein